MSLFLVRQLQIPGYSHMLQLSLFIISNSLTNLFLKVLYVDSNFLKKDSLLLNYFSGSFFQVKRYICREMMLSLQCC